MHFSCDEVYHKMRIRWKRTAHNTGKVWASISQVLPLRWVLLHFPVLREIDGANPCISHMIKYTVGWELYWEKSPILWEKYEYQFHRLNPYERFCCIFPYYEKLMRKHMHFRYTEIYHRMGIGWKKTPILWEKYHYRFPRFSPYHGFCCIFLYSGKFMGKPMHFPYAEVYQGMGIGWEKKHPYYGKSLSINFPDVPHTVGFVAFSRKCKCKGNPYISHMLKYTIGWESGWKKAPILWENYDCRFPRLSSYHGFCCICPYCGKFMGKPMYFRYVDIG